MNSSDDSNSNDDSDDDDFVASFVRDAKGDLGYDEHDEDDQDDDDVVRLPDGVSGGFADFAFEADFNAPAMFSQTTAFASFENISADDGFADFGAFPDMSSTTAAGADDQQLFPTAQTGV